MSIRLKLALLKIQIKYAIIRFGIRLRYRARNIAITVRFASRRVLRHIGYRIRINPVRLRIRTRRSIRSVLDSIAYRVESRKIRKAIFDLKWKLMETKLLTMKEDA